MQRRRGARRGLAALVIAALVLLQSTAAYADQHAGTDAYYWTGTVSGQTQCAYSSDGVTSYASGPALSEASTKSFKDLFCINNFPLPYHWLEAISNLQINRSGTWVILVSDDNYSAASSNSVFSYASYATCYGCQYRAGSGHHALLGGADRTNLMLTGTVSGL